LKISDPVNNFPGNGTSTKNIPSILHEGLLCTKSDKPSLGGKSWVTQYFVLDDCLNLSFFRSDKLRGQIVISHDTTVQLSHQRPHAFEITTPFVHFVAQAKNDMDRDDWILALQRVIQTATSEKRSETFRRIRSKAQELQKGKATGNGTHIFSASGQQFEVDVRYEFKRVVGQGAYGTVVSAHDNVTSTEVAIKKIKDVFGNVVDAKRILREIRIMKFLRHKNIASILDIMRPTTESDEEFNDVYIVMPLMDTDLHRVIYSSQKLTDQHVQFLMFQLISAVCYMQTAKVIHRDLKPPNILVNAACELKICDFGLARTMNEELSNDPTIYVVTRWYRAPELLCGCGTYTHAIDMWSVGCILAELLGRKPLFPGDSYLQQIQLIVKVIGQPTNSDLESLKDTTDPSVEDGPNIRYLKELPETPKIPWNQVPQLAKASEKSLDLLDKLLTFNSKTRITAEEALNHPYLAAYRGQKIDTCDGTFTETEDLNEAAEATRASMRVAILKEISNFRDYHL